ncbi:hypothetical protein, partial [Bradyrhizobium valentinum]
MVEGHQYHHEAAHEVDGIDARAHRRLPGDSFPRLAGPGQASPLPGFEARIHDLILPAHKYG